VFEEKVFEVVLRCFIFDSS